MNQSTLNAYLVKLTPLKPFFFGGEITFGADQQDNYLVKSNFYPQQTSILGMLRQLILHQTDLLIRKDRDLVLTDASKAKDYVGYQSFRPNKKQENDFGIIDRISPVFIFNKERYFQAPYDEGLVFEPEENGSTFQNKPLVKLHNYKPKNGVINQLMSIKKELNYLDKEAKPGVFIPQSQIGINKSPNGAADTDAFFKQTRFLMKDGFCFAFFLTLNDKMAFTPENTVTTLGGEKSLFKIEFVAQDTASWNTQISHGDNLTGKVKPPSDTNIKRVVLLSNTYAEPHLLNDTVFSITKSIPFRHWVTDLSLKHYHNLMDEDQSSNKAPRRSVKYNLLRKGSIFYVDADNLDDVTTHLDSFKDFQQIGYNYYQVL